MATPRHCETHRVAVASDPAATWSAVLAFEARVKRFARARRVAQDEGRSFVDEFAFDRAKVVWTAEVHPRGDGGTWIVFELRVEAESEAAWSAFLPTWIRISQFLRPIRRRVLRDFERRLGRARPDSERVMPGDQLVPTPGECVTHAITIDAPPDAVWPWIQQLQTHEHLVVLDVELQRAIVLGSPCLLAGATMPCEPSAYVVTWSFFLEPIGAHATHLIVRVRADFASAVLMRFARPVLSVLHSLMESAQLRRLKERAEAA